MISYYLSLRIRQFLRIYSFSDIHPLIGVPITLLLFVAVSALLYDRVPYPGWVYMALTIGVVTEAQGKRSNAYMRQMLPPAMFFKAKLAENFVLLLPFLLVLAYYHAYLQMALCCAFILPYSYFNISLPKPQLRAISTPYSQYAFEYNMVFRSMFLVYILYIALLVITGFAGNFFVFLVPFFIMLFFMQLAYSAAEDSYYIWVYRTSAGKFLMSKFNTLLRSYIITFTPFLLSGLIFYPGQFAVIGLCMFIGLLVMTGAMLIKYHFYPSAVIIQITQLLFFGAAMVCMASLQMLPVVIAFLIFSFFKARKRLKYILQC